MIDFGKMKVEGFASIANEEFDWGLEGLNVIQAPNGYGKTKFINALVWCLYGKCLSGSVEPWEHTRSSSYRGTRVEQEFFVKDIPIKVIRFKDYGRDKNRLELIIDDGEKDTGDKKDTQKEIEKLIGYSYELFKNSIIFGQKLKRIISESGPNKKKVFDDAFEIAYIPKAKKLAEEKLTEFRTEGLKALGIWELNEEKITGKKAEIEAEKKMVANFEEDKKKDVKEERELIKPLKEKKVKLIKENKGIDLRLQEYKSELELLEKDAYTDKEYLALEKKLTKLESKEDELSDKGVSFQQEIDMLSAQYNNVPDICDKCRRPFTKKEKEKEKKIIGERYEVEKENYQQLKDNTSKLRGQIKEIEGDIASAMKTKESIDSCKENIEELEEILKAISELKEKIQGYKDKIKKIKEKQLVNNIEKLSVELTDLQFSLKQKAKVVKRVQRDIKVNEWLIRDPLSNSGLKAFIFNQMLDSINERLEFYTKFIGFQVAFVIDMNSAHKNLETFVFKDGEPVPYEDLSGGQQQAVDIVTAFAIHDIVSDTKECSLLVMDEVFESLDKDNIEIMTELIQDKAQNKCLYVVTHRAEFNPTNTNLILIGYQNGVTSMV